MSYEQEFMKEFEAWVNTQIMINDMAHKESQKVYEGDQDERAKDAMIRYESRLDAYQFLLVSLKTSKQARDFMICQKACLVSETTNRYKSKSAYERTFSVYT